MLYPRACSVRPARTRAGVLLTGIASIALAASSCSVPEPSHVEGQGSGESNSAPAGKNAPAATPVPAQVGADKWLETFFPEAKEVLVAPAELIGQAAAYAIDEGMPLQLADAAPAPGTNAKRIDFAELSATKPELAQLPALDANGIVKRAAEKSGAGNKTAFVTPATPLVDVATAAASGAQVQVLPVADVRATSESMQAIAADSSQTVIVPAAEFGTAEHFAATLAQAKAGELPGGGGLVFPGRRMVALYGHPSGPALGALGEQDPASAVVRVQELAQHYANIDGEKVIPAFEIIATVASGSPGVDGDYSNETDPAELKPYVDAIVAAGGYAFLDLQPGRAGFLNQAQRYEELLKHPQVGLALDPEWKLEGNEVPLTNVGHVSAAEVNEVSDWLAALTRDYGLPQKGLIIHQFQLQMLRDREQIRMDHPELATIVHVDGHGPAQEKFATWDVVRQDLNPAAFLAWKNFIDEDQPMFSPEQTYAVDPRPWFVSYQ